MADMLKKLGDTAKSAVYSIGTLPPDSGERDTVRQNQEQVNALSAKSEPKESTSTPAAKSTEQDKVSPLARYGSKPGETRIDTDAMLKPLGSSTPVYDKGGDVSMDASKRLQSSADSGLQSFVNAPDENSAAPAPTAPAGKAPPTLTGAIADYRSKKASDAAGDVTTDRGDNVKQPSYMPKLAAPVYDEGGDVDVNDGKHQVAVLKEGEKVLTPEQADQYRKEHAEDKGAPADFGGRVFPNPTGIKPHADTDPVTPKVYPGGAKMSIANAEPDEGEKDAEHFPTAMATPASANTLKLKPYGQVMEEKANQKAAEQINAAQPEGGAPAEGGVPQPKAEEQPKKTYGSILADQWLKRNGMSNIEDTAQTPKEFQQPGAPQGAGPQASPAPAQGPMKPIVQPEPTGKEAFKAQMAAYDKAYQVAMDKAASTNDPQYREQAARIQEAKLSYEKAHPWGSPESAHPGVLGKIGHVAEQVLSRAPVSGPVMSTIPGSEASRARETTAAQAETKAAAEQNAAENKGTAIPGYHQVTGGAVDPQHPELGPQVAFESEKNPKDIVYQGPITPKTAGAGGDKATFEKTLAKIGTSDVADRNKQRTAIEQAHIDKKITDEEYNNANAYLGATV